MGETTDGYEPSAGLWYAAAGVSLFVLGGLLLANIDEAPPFLIGGLAFIGAGFYLLLVGAVARGIQLARLGRESATRAEQRPLQDVAGDHPQSSTS